MRRNDAADLLIAILAVALAAVLWTLLPGCSSRSYRAEATELLGPPAPPPATNQADADARVRQLEGQLTEAKATASAYRLEGVRRIVAWACGIAALVGIVGAGVAIFMRSKTLAMIPVACIGMVAMGLTTNVILDHPWLTMGGLAALIGALAGIPALRHRAEVALRQATTSSPIRRTDA